MRSASKRRAFRAGTFGGFLWGLIALLTLLCLLHN
jgi:hypothetical protein